MCRLPLNCSFLKIHPRWLVWHSFLKPLLFLDLPREINLQWQTDVLNTNLKFNWNYFMPLWSIVIHYFVLPWLQNGKRGRHFFYKKKKKLSDSFCLVYSIGRREVEYFHLVFELLEKINWVRPTGKSPHYFLPFSHACGSLPGAHTLPLCNNWSV